MIPFFRKIRKKMADDNRPLKYARYAIGEILLVVVGILIALQVDGWNEDRKRRSEEVLMLNTFKTSITKDSINIESYIKTFNDVNESIHILLDHMERNLPYHDSLNQHFTHSTQIWNPSIDQEYFSSLSSSDINIISNDSLKKEIISYYSFARRKFDVNIKNYASLILNASKDIYNTRFNALWNNTWNNPKSSKNKRFMIPNDYEELKKDIEFRYYLESQRNQLYFMVRAPLNEAGDKAMALRIFLDNELK